MRRSFGSSSDVSTLRPSSDASLVAIISCVSSSRVADMVGSRFTSARNRVLIASIGMIATSNRLPFSPTGTAARVRPTLSIWKYRLIDGSVTGSSHGCVIATICSGDTMAAPSSGYDCTEPHVRARSTASSCDARPSSCFHKLGHKNSTADSGEPSHGAMSAGLKLDWEPEAVRPIFAADPDQPGWTNKNSQSPAPSAPRATAACAACSIARLRILMYTARDANHTTATTAISPITWANNTRRANRRAD